MILINPEPCAVLIEKPCSKCGGINWNFNDMEWFTDDDFQNKPTWSCTTGVSQKTPKYCNVTSNFDDVFKVVWLNDKPYTVEMEVLESD